MKPPSVFYDWCQQLRNGQIDGDYFWDQLLVFIREDGYVKPARDQSLPPFPFICGEPTLIERHERSQEDMLAAGWRKVVLT